MRNATIFYLAKLLITSIFLWAFNASAAPAKDLQTFKDCTFIETEWADGDSFRIKTATGDEHTIRLYGVDCMELHLGDVRNLNRLREQRRYFGIFEAGKNNEESMKIALDLALEAKNFTAKCLMKSFTLHTRFTDGRGAPEFPRIYGFITLQDGRDLGTVLVQEGLARAVGTLSTMPDGNSMTESKEMLKDFEIQALKKGRGIWAKTNWDKLPAERQVLRKEKAEVKIAEKLKGPGPDFKINPNTATIEQLIALDDIGPAIAKQIIEEREKMPFKNIEDLDRVKNLTKPTLEKIRPRLDFTKQ